MSLPIANGLEIAGRDLGASDVGSSCLGCSLLLACRFQLFRQGGGAALRRMRPERRASASSVSTMSFFAGGWPWAMSRCSLACERWRLPLMAGARMGEFVAFWRLARGTRRLAMT